MGLAALRDVLDPQPVDLELLRGSTLALDANNLLWTFVTGMARGGAPTGPHGRPISHVLGLANRVSMFENLGVRTVWVFDGVPPELKEETLQEREAKIQAAREAGKEVQGTKLEGFQIDESKALLDALGLPWLQAPCEADAQLACWVQQGTVDAAVTQDYDIALHGCPVTYRNVKKTGQRSPERLDLFRVLEGENLSREQLVDAAILIGTDYNDGIHGVGPVTALSLVREHGDLFAALDARGVEMPRAAPVRELFLKHPVDREATPRFDPPNRDEVQALFGEHGLSADRADRVVDAMVQARQQLPV